MTKRLFLLAGLAWVIGTHGIALGQSTIPEADRTFEQPLNERVPGELVFRDERNEPVALGQYWGTKPVILVLAYYRCPRLCSVILNNLADSLKRVNLELGRDFTVVTVSIDPRETAELASAKRSAYADYLGRDAKDFGWHFLTGDEASIRRLADAVGYRFAWDTRTGQYAHSSGLVILTPEGTISRTLFGIDFSPRDLRFGLEDAAAGGIGSPVARPLRLFCYAYDPQTGRYTLLTLRLVRLAGVVTVLGLLVLAWRMRRTAPVPSIPGVAR